MVYTLIKKYLFFFPQAWGLSLEFLPVVTQKQGMSALLSLSTSYDRRLASANFKLIKPSLSQNSTYNN